MRKIAWCAAAGILILASSASANFIAILSGSNGQTNFVVPPEGRVFDIEVTVTRDAGDGGQGISAVQFDLAASSAAPYSIQLFGVEGSAGLAGTGTRYNDAEWESETTGGGLALDPDLAAGQITETPRGPLGTGYLTGLWTTSSSVVAHLKLFVSGIADGQTVTLTPTNVLAFPDWVTATDDIAGQGVGITFIGVPEPAGTLLLLAGLGLFCRRRR